MKKKQYKSLTDKNICTLSVMREDEKYFYVEIRALKPGVNRNNWDFTMSGIEKNGKSFVGQPLLIAYKGDKIGDGHNYDLTLNPKTGEIEADFRDGEAERIVGEITAYRIEEQVGETWLILSAMIWKYYAQQLVDYIIDTKAMSVSVEVMVADDYEIRDDGVEVFENWEGLGVTILGQGVTPAVEGARLRALTASNEYKEMRVLAASYVPQTKKSIKGGTLKMNEATRKLLAEALKEHGIVMGFTADGKYASVFRTNGIPAFYPCADFNESDGVIPSKFIDARVMLSAEITVGEETEQINCAADYIITKANADAETAKADVENAKNEAKLANENLEKANERIAELEKAEKDRLLSEQTKAFDEAVKAHNLSVVAEEMISEEEMNVIHNSIQEGKFADVDSVLGEFKKLAYDKHVANTKREPKTLAWNVGNKDLGTLEGEEAIVAKYANKAK